MARVILIWLARLLSMISLIVLGMFLFGGSESLRFRSWQETVGFLCFPVGVASGMAIGWIQPRIGGIVCLVSLIAFYVWHTLHGGRLPAGPYFFIFASPGLIFLVASFLPRSVAAVSAKAVSAER